MPRAFVVRIFAGRRHPVRLRAGRPVSGQGRIRKTISRRFAALRFRASLVLPPWVASSPQTTDIRRRIPQNPKRKFGRIRANVPSATTQLGFWKPAENVGRIPSLLACTGNSCCVGSLSLSTLEQLL